MRQSEPTHGAAIRFMHMQMVELMKMAIRMPDTMKVEREEIDATEWDKIKEVIEAGLTNI
jgi:hypothetical protein